jgi:hypothetical protein
MFLGLGISWLCMSLALALIVCSCSEERRPWFAVRLAVVLLIPFGLVAILAAGYYSGVVAARAAHWLLIAAMCGLAPGVLLAPALLFKTAPYGGDGGGGGGPGPGPPPSEPEPPGGELPVAHARQASARVRDHSPVWRPWRPARRVTREPDRPLERRPRSAARVAADGRRRAV